MTRYHISSTTGKPVICRAQTEATCRAKPLFGETKHFADRGVAAKWVERKMNAMYSQDPKKKNETLVEKKLALLKDCIETEERFPSPYNLFTPSGPLNGFTQLDFLERIDYMNEILAESPEGDLIIVHTYGGDWAGDHRIFKAEHVKAKTVQTPHFADERVEEISNPELVEIFKEYARQILPDQSVDATSFALDGFAYYSDKKKLEKAGWEMSKIHPEGDLSLLNAPQPYMIDVPLYENGERQNARVFEEGFVFMNKKKNEGYVFIVNDSSEGMHEDSWVKLRNGKVTPMEGSTRFYRLLPTGDRQQTYYEKISQVEEDYA